MNEIICQAIRHRKLLMLRYRGRRRLVIPHCYGITTTGKPGLRAFQVRNTSQTRQLPAWKLFDLTLASGIRITDLSFDEPMPLHQCLYTDMEQIFCTL